MEYDSVAQLDAELLNPSLDIDRRAELMAARITIDQRTRSAPPRVEAPTGFRVSIPANLAITDVVGPDGRRYQAIAVGDQRYIDVTPGVFRILLMGPDGLDWSRANEGTDVWERMNPGFHAN